MCMMFICAKWPCEPKAINLIAQNTIATLCLLGELGRCNPLLNSKAINPACCLKRRGLHVLFRSLEVMEQCCLLPWEWSIRGEVLTWRGREDLFWRWKSLASVSELYILQVSALTEFGLIFTGWWMTCPRQKPYGKTVFFSVILHQKMAQTFFLKFPLKI